MTKVISDAEYELALLCTLEQEFPPPMFDVRGTRDGVKHYIRGRKSGQNRQLDAAVYRRGDDHPFLVADAKNRGRPIDITAVDHFSAFLQDVGCQAGMLVVPREPRSTTPYYAQNCGIEIQVMTEEDALTARWLPTCRRLFPCDWAFHPQMSKALEYILNNRPPHDILVAMEAVPFDEWNAFMLFSLQRHRNEALAFLRFQIANHHDYSWRAGTIAWCLNERIMTLEEAWSYEPSFCGHYEFYGVMREFAVE